MNMIDIIIPVYSGLSETKRCLESVLSHPQATDHELIVINDQSPDPLLRDYLEHLANAKLITLITNPSNLGFVGTVNIGMQLHEDRDVVLLNSDTVPVNDWLDRLVACSYRDAKIGTATPFSNNATICSYPNFCQDNTIPLGMELEELDINFKKANTGKWIEIPTAVGFCMFIRRDCLRQVGYFDVDTFGKGYGEENDFCMRAKSKGWKNILCGDVFVYHAGNVSFGDGHDELKLAAMDKLRKLHPSYEYLVHRHISDDPAKTLRRRVMLASLLNHSKPLILYISHNKGGGTERHLQELIKKLLNHIDAIVLRPLCDEIGVVEIDYHGLLKFYFNIDEELDELTDFLRTLNVVRIHIHHTIGIHPAVFSLPERLDVRWDYTVHDYYTICPQINLADTQGRYCGEPDEDDCNACLQKRPAPGGSSIKTWRGNHISIVTGAERCFAPSKDTANRFKAYFPSANVIPVYHEQTSSDKIYPAELPRQSIDRLKIVVIGALSQAKGADSLESAALDAQHRDLPIDFVLLGYCYRDMIVSPQSKLTVVGAYQEEDLSRLISYHQPDIIWFPALWPETYSYTLSEALKSGLPIVAPNIGAFPERLYNRKYTWIVPWDISEQSLNDFFINLKSTIFSGHDVGLHEQYISRVNPVAEYFSYEEYLISRINHKMADPINLEQFAERWGHYLVMENRISTKPIFFRLASIIRYSTLFCLVRMKKYGAYRWLVNQIPQMLQVRIKDWLLKSQ